MSLKCSLKRSIQELALKVTVAQQHLSTAGSTLPPGQPVQVSYVVVVNNNRTELLGIQARWCLVK
jgi:hypothetical protein